MTPPKLITLRPALSYALWRSVLPTGLSLLFLVLAWTLSPVFIWCSLAFMLAAVYRLRYIRSIQYVITEGSLQVSSGLLFKRTDYLELFRVKDYILTRPVLMQVFGLMNLTLKSTDPENPVLTLTGIPAMDLVGELREWVQRARALNCIMEIN
ncbi:PH domain-containing protein [Mucilaginibacter robiniae]|uniref:PH domain-containing protein n=1 Tax=Mucilaginibacter robiniae TaxID=2728022 RepID=A0A7L5DWD1_9SPHI|nr:PH domain-containing protein [Mucilaginibacter robiniae]